MDTLLLDLDNWDLVIDANGNIAKATEPYSLAQDAAAAIQTYLGEVWFDTTTGVPWLTEILAKNPPLGLLKSRLVAAALTVPGVASAECFLTALSGRIVSGQVQVTPASGGPVSAANFTVINPQTGGPA